LKLIASPALKSGLLWLTFFPGLCVAQSTEGLISGRITDAITNKLLAGAAIQCVNRVTNLTRATQTDKNGIYVLAELSPGLYEIKVSGKDISGKDYQSLEQDEVALGVADALVLNFELRPLDDLWERNLHKTVLLPGSHKSIVNFQGPDVGPNLWTTFSPNPGETGKLQASISDAVSPADISTLPLNGENVYTILLAEPGVSANVATGRSLGIAANGQRPSSSNFLIDGVDANFYLVTGPIFSLTPEMTQEYRLSTNNFSAEYGGASGYIANAATRSGGDAWHGLGYFELANTVLNANDFQANSSGMPRVPDHEDRFAAFLGGPILKNRLFLGASLEYFRSESQLEPQAYDLPNSEFLTLLGCPSSGSYACSLLQHYPVSSSTALDPFVAKVSMSQPVTLDQWLNLERLDYVVSHRSRLMVRFVLSDLSRPDFIWSPYADYVSGAEQPARNLAVSLTSSLSATVTNQLVGGWADQQTSWARAQPDVPTLVAVGGNSGAIPILPGSPAAYGLDYKSPYFQMYDDVTIVHRRHILKTGGGLFWRRTTDLLSYGGGGEYFFCDVLRFGYSSAPCPASTTEPATPAIQFTASISRGLPLPVQPDFARSYKSVQSFLYAQDSFRATSRLYFNFGLRFDRFGSPSYSGSERDWSVQFGSGATFNDRVANATLVPPSTSTNSLFTGQGPSFAPRLGFAYDLQGSGHTTLRGGFGLFYDRLFDNLWLNAMNNSFILPSPVAVNGYEPVSSALQSLSPGTLVDQFPRLTAFQPNLHNGYAEDFFLALRTEPAAGLSFEVSGAGSLGRRLVTTDVINPNSITNSSLPSINYLSNQGLSDYYSLSLVSRWRSRFGFLQAAYTWSHVIDLQSDPLAGSFFDLDFVNVGPPTAPSATAPNGASFSNLYDSRGDRGNADFDQRQTLVFYSSWRIPRGGDSVFRRLISGFTFSQLAAVRSGFPYSIFTAISASTPEVVNAYAHPLDAAHPLLTPPRPVTGGEQLFVASAFCPDNTCSSPPSSRNVFAGPGLINLDVSAARVFRIPRLREGTLFMLRADAFNFLNHANLNPPGNTPGPGYGVALFGTPPTAAGFPSVVPLGPTSRQIQLSLRISF